MIWTPQFVAEHPVKVCVERSGQDARGQTSALIDAPTVLEGVQVVARRGGAGIPPEREYGPAEIDALGASDIGEVIGRFNSAMGSRDTPIVIVNGQRVADPSVFLPFPPDALSRVEILPPSAGAAYGAQDLSRRVVNIVLQRRFEGRDAIASTARPAAGGQSSDSGDLRQSKIVDLSTSRVGLRISRDTALRANERPDYMRDHPDDGAVTLRPRSRRLALDAAFTRVLGGWNGSLGVNGQRLISGFTSHAGGQEVQNRTDQRSLTVNGSVGGQTLGWTVRALLMGQVLRTQSSGLSSAQMDNQAINVSIALNRDILSLPAGPVSLDLSGQVSRSWASTAQPESRRDLAGRTASAGAQVSVPLHRVRQGNPSGGFGLGDLSMSLGVVGRSTDTAHGADINTSAYWSPAKAVSFNGSWSRSISAPSDDQRFGPAVYAAPITVYDFRTGRSVAVLPLIGGNANLRSPRREAQMLGVSIGPFGAGRLFANLSYRRSTATDEIAALLGATTDIEAAFPDRFKRDANGELLSIDRRPINVASDASQTVVTTLTATFASPRAGRKDSSVLQVSVDHVWRLSDSMLIGPGLPRMDRLAGDSSASPAQQLNVHINARRGRLVGSLRVNWRDAYRVRADSGRDGPRDLKVEATGTANVKLSYAFDAAERPSSSGSTSSRRLRGVTLALDIDNLFDTRPRAHLSSGARAPGYGRSDQDPVGRLIRLILTSRF